MRGARNGAAAGEWEYRQCKRRKREERDGKGEREGNQRETRRGREHEKRGSDTGSRA